MVSGSERVRESSRHLLDDLRPADDDLVFQDGLTGLYNRRLLTRFLEESWEVVIERCDDLSIIMIDLNLFKEVNDRYGHLSGDEVLRITAKLLRGHFRNGDLVFRYGGDEFLVLLPGAPKAEADRLAERARQSMSEHEFFSHERHERIDVPLTFCIGIASYPVDGLTADQLIAYADAMMYHEKQRARRRTRTGPGLLPKIAAALLLALIPAGLLLRWDDIAGLRDESSTAIDPVAAAPVEMQTLSPDRMQLLEQIEALERQIDELRSAGPVPSVEEVTEAPEASGGDDTEVELLRSQIAQLTAQLREGSMRPEPAPGRNSPPPQQAPPAIDVVPAAPPRDPPTGRRPEAPPPARDVVTAPRLLERITPRYPRMARRLGKEAEIDLIVRVDGSGRVVDARIVGPRPGFGFEEAALEAAMRSKWAAGLRDGTPEAMETGLRVTFRMPR